MTEFNRTDFSLEEIRKFDLLQTGKNNWRQRNIELYQHPTEEDKVVSIGTRFDGAEVIICVELKSDWSRELQVAPRSFVTN